MDKIELTKIPVKGLILDESIEFNKEDIQNVGILEIKNTIIKGDIIKNINQDIYLNAKVNGLMILPDARNLEPIEFLFTFELNEKIDETNENIEKYFEKSKNTLDIMGILWENIVLEVPMRITNSEVSKTDGEGWEFVLEKQEVLDPRLDPLRQLLDNEKE